MINSSSTAPVIVWFRHDLRIADNPAMIEAGRSGKPVIAVFIWAPEEEESWSPGAASRWWLHRSLEAHAEELRRSGVELYLMAGNSAELLESLAIATGADTIYWSRRYEPAYHKRDNLLEQRLQARGIHAVSLGGNLLFEPWEVSTGKGDPYQVFTPFWKACMKLTERRSPLGCPEKICGLHLEPQCRSGLDLKTLDELDLLPEINWYQGLETSWQPGERGARERLGQFLGGTLTSYDSSRDYPAEKGVSYLSPHIHFGEISVHYIWSKVSELLSEKKEHRESILTYLKELGWREFSHHVLYHFPHTADAPLRQQFERFPWVDDSEALKRWTEGRTGYPIVDAAMRELWETGWMHNRARMIVASFLTKDLMISWRQGARWFWDTLVDADLANNTLGWQWAGGCGADAAPYFRIFNPVMQGEKFDPGGVYVRKWVPELKCLPDRWIHKPWMASPEVLAQAAVRLGEDYPEPIVDHKWARERALEALRSIKS